MTRSNEHVRRAAAVPAAAMAAALALAGCSATHVGDAWQCPLAQGNACGSVAAADPAVPGADGGAPASIGDPLYRVRGGNAPDAAPPAGRACDADCGDPFAWLARLFGADDDDNGPRENPSATESAAPAGAANPAALPRSPAIPAAGAAALPARPDPGDGGLRTGEVVARIWIAPFVDADGVYREASHVRVVLEPAGWNLK